MDVLYNGSVNYDGYWNGKVGVRPVVYLPADILAHRNADGIWELEIEK